MAGADWSLPTVTSNYTDVMAIFKQRDIDAATMFVDTASNIPTGSVRWNRSLFKFQEWNGSAWTDMVLGIASGGTGSSTAAGARTALGLGSLATQNSNSVSITGGSISGVNIDASAITSGILPLNRGGTGNTLVQPAIGYFLRSTGTTMEMSRDGSYITDLHAGYIATGEVALARGGTGASLSIGAAGTFLRSNGSVVSFSADGSALTSLNANNISSGTLSNSRLSTDVVLNGSTPEFASGTTVLGILRLNHSGSRYLQYQNGGDYYTFGGGSRLEVAGGFVLTELDYTDYTVTKSGSGAFGTWNIAITGNAATATTASAVPGSGITGSIPAATLGSGTPSSSTFLRGDLAWQTIAFGGTRHSYTPSTTGPITPTKVTLVQFMSDGSSQLTGTLNGTLVAASILGAGTGFMIVLPGETFEVTISGGSYNYCSYVELSN